jgi:hypothetical protein
MADERKGVLAQHRERMTNDPAYREAALTPPGNHPPGGHVDDVQRLASGAAAADILADGDTKDSVKSK